MDEEESVKTELKQDRRLLNPNLYKKGQSGNPAGRPKGSKSLKTYVKERLEAMTEEEREEYLDGIDKRVIWEMAEGKPKQDVAVEGEVSMLVKIDE